MKRIPLTKGLFALVDDEDFEWLNQWKWHSNLGYAKRNSPWQNKKRQVILMHREVLGVPVGLLTDHINGVRHDNRRCNLRVATMSENKRNATKQVNNTTGFKGVRNRYGGKFAAVIQPPQSKQIWLGTFKTAEEAHLAYCKAATKLHGEFVRTV